jgi:RNA polymerase sigma factor (sigma-70 family)
MSGCANEFRGCQGADSVNKAVASDDTTALLIARARAGDPQAWEAVIGPLLRTLRRFAERRLPADVRRTLSADDLVQDALINGLKRLHCFEFRRKGAWLAYLRKSICHRIVDELRRIRGRPVHVSLTDHLQAAPSALQQVIERENRERFSKALARLDRRSRELIVLRVEGQVGFTEIASRLGIPTTAAARVAVKRAFFRLAHAVDEVDSIRSISLGDRRRPSPARFERSGARQR